MPSALRDPEPPLWLGVPPGSCGAHSPGRNPRPYLCLRPEASRRQDPSARTGVGRAESGHKGQRMTPQARPHTKAPHRAKGMSPLTRLGDHALEDGPN